MAASAATIELPGGRFGVLRAGAPGRPLVIVLHGFPDHPPTFAPILEALAAAGHEVAAPWLRGYAPSPLAGPFGIERLAADVLELATALGHDRFALVGHDWGAAVAYAVGALAPGRLRAAVTIAVPHPLALMRAWVTSGQLARSWYMFAFQLPGAAAAARARDFAFVDWLWRRWSPGLVLDEPARRDLHACLAASWPAPLALYRAMFRPPGEAVRRLAPASPAARRIVAPVLHLQGERDGCIAPAAGRGQARHFAGPFRSEVLPGRGHFAHVEAPGEVAARALAWLAEHAPADADVIRRGGRGMPRG